MKTLFNPTLGWFTLSTLLIFSPQLSGCSTDVQSNLSQEDGTAVTPVTVAPAPAPTVIVPDAGSQVTGALTKSSLEPSKEKAELTRATLSAAANHPEVKRLVVASDVEQREPVALQDGKIDEPVVAFVEMSNSSTSEVKVVITFEHEGGERVGFIELSVPGRSARYRTWGRTRNIRTPGEWTAIIATATGEELARQTFSVTS